MDIKSEKIKEEPQCNDFAVSIANIKYEKDYELFTDDVKTERDVDIENQINKILGTTVKEELDDEMLETDIFKEIPEVKDEPSSDDEAEHSLPGIKSEEVMLKSESEADDSERGIHSRPYENKSRKTKGKKGIFKCQYCEYSTHRKACVQQHTLTKHYMQDLKKHVCILCDYKCYYRFHLKRHFLARHDTTTVKKYACDYCDYKSHREWTIKNHTRLMHSYTSVKKYGCDFCDFRTHYKHCLRLHVFRHHNKASKVGGNSGENKRKYDDESSYRVVANCNVPSSAVVIHDRNGPKEYRCKLCQFKTYRISGLKRHLSINHDRNSKKKTNCNLCVCKSSCKKTEIVENDEEPVESYKPFRKDHVAKHLSMKQNDSGKNYICFKCGYSTDERTHIVRHIRDRHDKNSIKKYVCDQCDYKSHRRCNLDRHLKTHEKILVGNFRCDVCSYRTNANWKLVYHKMSKHDKNYVKKHGCDQCTYRTDFMSDMKRHMKARHS